MNIDTSKFTSIFQQNKPNMLNNRQLSIQKPLNNMLNKIANKVMDTQQNGSEYEFQTKMQNIKTDTYTKIQESENLDEIEPEILEYYAAILNLYSRDANFHEDELNTFKEQLISFDQDIQNYQDILNGNTDLPDDTTMNDILNLLTTTKQAREEYLKNSCNKLNKWDSYKADSFDHTINKVLGQNKFSEMSDKNWQIDASTSDIYSEIDRVSEATRKVSQTLNDGLKRIYDVLDKKGYGYEKYQLNQTTSQNNSNTSVDNENTNSLQLLLASMKNESSILR
ncbi:hypothetical protein [Anaerovorax odorimutans]|uniref:hypothetical protein n=1 Tax=Anaerovorax odorimutans TaxID=109327 RepID=UPI00040FB7D6|nr:hypothetical protein [Anaerovorax odorimutans]